MSNEVLVEAPKVTIGFERKVNLGDYESATASIFIQVPTEAGQTAEQMGEAAKLAFADAKATVYEQLGITIDVVEGVVIEKLRQSLGAVEVASSPAPVQQRATTQTTTAGTPAPETKDALWEELASNPKKWFDNREGKRNPNAPDFKRKQTGEALWLEHKGKSQVPAGITVPSPSEF